MAADSVYIYIVSAVLVYIIPELSDLSAQKTRWHCVTILQGRNVDEIKRLLCTQEMAQAVHQLLAPYANVLPALSLAVRDVAVMLRRAADSLQFVKVCHTRVQFKSLKGRSAPQSSLAQVLSPSFLMILLLMIFIQIFQVPWRLCSTRV